MSSDHFPGSGSPFQVNYRLPWGVFVVQLVKTLFTQKASVEAWDGSRLVVIRAKPRALAIVESCKRDKTRQDHLEVEILSKYEKTYSQNNSWTRKKHSQNWGRLSPLERSDLSPQYWSIPALPGTILAGDIVCLLDGAQTPTIIRLCGNYWSIVMAWTPLTFTTDNQPYNPPDGFFDDFLLVWDWEVQSQATLRRPIFLGDMQSSRVPGFLENRMSNKPEDEAKRLV